MIIKDRHHITTAELFLTRGHTPGNLACGTVHGLIDFVNNFLKLTYQIMTFIILLPFLLLIPLTRSHSCSPGWPPNQYVAEDGCERLLFLLPP